MNRLWDRIWLPRDFGSQRLRGSRKSARESREWNNLALDVKFLGYNLARDLARALPVKQNLTARRVNLRSKPSIQADLESEWAAYWCAQLKSPVRFHRKIWELVYVLQAFYENGAIRQGARGLGFGCGKEPIASFLASQEIETLVTDLAPDAAAAKAWVDSGQHTSLLDNAFHSHLVSRDHFDRMARHRYVDMNDIPGDLRDFDFCWSICSLEHLGSIANGLEFVRRAMRTLRSGGVAVHTTEFNLADDGETIDNRSTVLFQRKHFEQLAASLRQDGHTVAPFDFNTGMRPMDRFIDIPPYLHEWSDAMRRQFGKEAFHLKLSIEGFISTCFGLIVIKGA